MRIRPLAIALTAVVACRLLLATASLPGVAPALAAVALLLGVTGWAFNAAGDPGLGFRRDVFVGLATGIIIALASRLVW
jgi:CHASE2 domain-containing sensor protein